MPLRRRPLAETLVAFAGLDETRLQDMDLDALGSQLTLAYLVWNAVLLAEEEAGEAGRRGEDGEAAFEQVIAGLLAQIRGSLGDPEPDIDGGEDELESIVRYLVVRKLELHGTDRRPVADVHVERSPEGRRVVVAIGLS